MNNLGHRTNFDHITESLLPAYSNGLITSTAGKVSFVHDRVRLAFYGQLSDTTKYRIHIVVGRYIMEQREQILQAAEDNISLTTTSSDSDSKYDNLLLEGLYHLNRGIPLLFDERADEKVALHYSSLNKQAAEQARQAIAYESSLSFLRSSVELFKYAEQGNTVWSEEYSAYGFSLYALLCEVLVLNHMYEEAKEKVASLELQCRTDLQRAT